MNPLMSPTLSLDQAAAQAWDIIVVGAGPAGALAALLLARRGRRVLLVERSSFPRDKACGCCLNGAGADVLRRVGLGDVVDSAPRLDQLLLRRNRSEICLALPGSVCIPRDLLDTRIVEAAIAAGVQFIPACNARLVPVTGRPGATMLPGNEDVSEYRHHGLEARATEDHPPAVCPQGVGTPGYRQVHLQHDGRQRVVAAALVLACDGIRGSLLDGEAACRWEIAGDGWMGAAITLDTPMPWAPQGSIAMHVASSGYVGAVRLADGRTHLAAALDPVACKRAGGPVAMMRSILQSCGVADLPEINVGRVVSPNSPPACDEPLGERSLPKTCDESLDEWPLPQTPTSVARVLATPLLTRRRTQLGAHRVLAVGDACGYVEPFTGEGMTWALQSAEALVAMLPESLADWPADLPQRWTRHNRRLLGTQQAICRSVRYCLHRSTMAAVAFAIAGRVPGLGRAVARMIGRHNAAPQIGVAS